MEDNVDPRSGIKMSPSQQKAREKMRAKIEKQNRENKKRKDMEERAAKRATEVANAAAATAAPTPALPVVDSPPCRMLTSPPTSSLEDSSPQLNRGPSFPAQTSQAARDHPTPSPERILGHSAQESGNARPSSSSSASLSASLSASSSSTMETNSTPIGSLVDTDFNYAASVAFYNSQLQHNPNFFKGEAALKKKDKKTAKQREYRQRIADNPGAASSTELGNLLAEQSKVNRERYEEQRKAKRQKRLEEQSRVDQESLAEAANKEVAESQRLAKEKREATKAAMAGQEVIVLD